MKNKDRAKLKAEIILIAAIIIIAVFIYLYMNVTGEVQKATVQILENGVLTKEYDLFSNQTIYINTYDGGQNVLVITDGSCHMEDANCPDKLCVSQGTISKSGQSIICLPHKLVITISGEDEQETDAVSR